MRFGHQGILWKMVFWYSVFLRTVLPGGAGGLVYMPFPAHRQDVKPMGEGRRNRLPSRFQALLTPGVQE
jgi:hypothetical protein